MDGGAQTRTREEGSPCPVGNALLETEDLVLLPLPIFGTRFCTKTHAHTTEHGSPQEPPCPGLSAPLNLRHPGSLPGIH